MNHQDMSAEISMADSAVIAKDGSIQKLSTSDQLKLYQGDILVKTRPHTLCGGALDSKMYLPTERSLVWDQITHYPQWVSFLPDVTQSRVIEENSNHPHRGKRLYQAAEKSFLFITAQVHIYLTVFELEQQHIRFQFERGSFADFTADLKLSDLTNGTLLEYSVSATPLIPVPSFFVEQAMKMDLPNNLRALRTAIEKNCR